VWLLLAIATAGATDIYKSTQSNGTVTFTDAPVDQGSHLWIVDDHPPLPRDKVSDKSYPKIDRWDALILAASARHGVPATLIKAVCLAESGMNPNAKSHAGAMGLMQLMPGTADHLGVKNPWDPYESIEGGTKYLASLIERFGPEYRLVAAGYNAGPGNVIKYGGVPPFKETKVYVERVMDYRAMFMTERPIDRRALDPSYRAP
jgi:hypothetical protein